MNLSGSRKRFPVFGRNVALLGVIGLCLAGATRHRYSSREKAAFADPASVEFVRPGLVIKITGAHIASDGTISVGYTVTDASGLQLVAGGITHLSDQPGL
jgi:hypothetical protein